MECSKEDKPVKCSEYVKLAGVPSVKALAEHEGVARSTIIRRYDMGYTALVDAAIRRYKEGK